MINTDMFRRIHEQITAHPETHYQGTFEADCGTTRCVAGWAVHFWGVDKNLDSSLDIGALSEVYVSTQDIGFKPESEVIELGWEALEAVAADILGLDNCDANRLFYTMNDEEAVRFVESFKAGVNPFTSSSPSVVSFAGEGGQ